MLESSFPWERSLYYDWCNKNGGVMNIALRTHVSVLVMFHVKLTFVDDPVVWLFGGACRSAGHSW